MKYLILISVILAVVSCSKSDETNQPSSTTQQTFDLTTAKGLCLYVINEAEKETGDMKPLAMVTDAYKNITCLEVTSEHIPLWQCYKDRINLDNGFAKADEFCNDNY